METPARHHASRLPAWTWILSLFAFGLLLRLSCWNVIWQPETGLLFKSPDSYYHLRRVMLALMAPEQLTTLDYWRGLSHTEPCIWPIQYSWLLALWVWILTLGQMSPDRIEWIVAAFPIFVGLATAAIIYLLARRIAPKWAWLALLLYLILPMNINISQLTEIDHHIAETLAFSLSLFCLTKLENSGKRACLFGSSAALCLLFVVWSGSTLYAAILSGLLAVWGLLRPSKGLADMALAFELAGLALACFYPWQGSWQLLIRYDSPSLFQPLLLLAGGLCLHALAWRKDRPRYALAAAAALVGLGTVLAWQILLGLDFIWGQGGGYAFVSQVAELQPIGLKDLPLVLEVISPLVLAGPLLAIWLLRDSWRSGDLLSYLLPSAFLAFVVLSLDSRRFLYIVSLLLPLLLAAFMERGSEHLRLRLKSLVLICIALSGSWSLGMYLNRQRTAGPALHPSYVATADWLRKQTPSAGDWLKASKLPGYGVLDNWEKGHFLLVRAQRPVVSDNFGLQADFLHDVLSLKSEREALERLQKSQVRYVVLGTELLWEAPALLGTDQLKSREPWLAQKQFDYLGQTYSLGYLGSGFQSSLYYRLMFPELLPQTPQNMRLVYESKETVPVHLFLMDQDPFLLYGQSPPPGQQPQFSNPSRFRIYERVAGALIRGQTVPNAQGRLQVGIRTNTGRRFNLNWTIQADAQGRYTQRVPYAVSDNPEISSAEGPYQLEIAGQKQKILIREADILQERQVEIR